MPATDDISMVSVQPLRSRRDWREALLPVPKNQRRAWYYTAVVVDQTTASLAVLPPSSPRYWGSAIGAACMMGVGGGGTAVVAAMLGDRTVATIACSITVLTMIVFAGFVLFDIKSRRSREPLLVCERGSGRVIGGLLLHEWADPAGTLCVERVVIVDSRLRFGLESRPLFQLQLVVRRADDGGTDRKCILCGVYQFRPIARKLASAIGCEFEIVDAKGGRAPTVAEWCEYTGQ